MTVGCVGCMFWRVSGCVVTIETRTYRIVKYFSSMHYMQLRKTICAFAARRTGQVLAFLL